MDQEDSALFETFLHVSGEKERAKERISHERRGRVARLVGQILRFPRGDEYPVACNNTAQSVVNWNETFFQEERRRELNGIPPPEQKVTATFKVSYAFSEFSQVSHWAGNRYTTENWRCSRNSPASRIV